MATFLVAAVFMMVMVALMAIGVLLGRKPIGGSCGGLTALGMKTACDVCGGDQSACDKEKGRLVKAAKPTDLAYDAAAESNEAQRAQDRNG